ncbi:hypothetical protein P0136_07825 [Lentisphaerota bacterium ZTH]|nr:hypothetical protein P0136_07825 [Lentisphaerota bacterium ZTH]
MHFGSVYEEEKGQGWVMNKLEIENSSFVIKGKVTGALEALL